MPDSPSRHSASQLSASLPPGLGQRYEIRAEVGRGATGTVYRAWDTFAQREVALKVAHAQIFNDDPELALVRKAAELGDADAQAWLGSFFDGRAG